MQLAGIDLTAVIAAACRYLGIEEKKLARPTRRVEIARARALISYVSTQILSISEIRWPAGLMQSARLSAGCHKR